MKRKIVIPTTHYIERDYNIYIKADDLISVIDFIQEEVGYDPGLNALKSHLLQVQLKALREVRHRG